MLRQESALRETLNIGQDIMKRCHPDAVSTMKHWLGVLRTRWEEVKIYSLILNYFLFMNVTDHINEFHS